MYMLEVVGIAEFADRIGVERIVVWELVQVKTIEDEGALAALSSERTVDKR